MASMAAEFTMQWAGQLADLADHVTKEMPEKEEWGIIRNFLSNTSRMLRKGDIKSGFRAVMRILPYVQRALSSAEKCSNIQSTFDITDSISRHFLVNDAHKDNLNNFIKLIKSKTTELKKRMDKLAVSLDDILDVTIEKGETLSWWQGLKLAFEINRISALIRTCEDHLVMARGMIDELDSHVAGKSFLANVFTYVAFLFGVAFSASGNVPVGAACISAATATRKAATSLDDYRRELTDIDNHHRLLQAELIEWKHKFTAEQRNFLFLFGPQKAATVLVIIIAALVMIGKIGNIAVFSIIVGMLFLKSHTTHSNRYNVIIVVAIAAIWGEYQQMQSLFCFNTLTSVSLLANYLGLIDFWW